MCSVNTAGNAEATRYDGTRYSNDKASTLSADGVDWEEPEPAAVMILPPSYVYPVPNDVEGDLVATSHESLSPRTCGPSHGNSELRKGREQRWKELVERVCTCVQVKSPPDGKKG